MLPPPRQQPAFGPINGCDNPQGPQQSSVEQRQTAVSTQPRTLADTLLGKRRRPPAKEAPVPPPAPTVDFPDDASDSSQMSKFSKAETSTDTSRLEPHFKHYLGESQALVKKCSKLLKALEERDATVKRLNEKVENTQNEIERVKREASEIVKKAIKSTVR